MIKEMRKLINDKHGRRDAFQNANKASSKLLAGAKESLNYVKEALQAANE